MTTLALDIGNTRRKMGLFREAQLLESAVVTDWPAHKILKYSEQTGVSEVIVSSVKTSDEVLSAFYSEGFNLLELTHETPLPFENQYKTPQTLGKDRLAAVAGAQALFPGRNCLVVDCGTCIKYDLITVAGEFLGGNISPGARMRARAMHEFTDRLPEVEMGLPAESIGDSTQHALQNGAFLGAVHEIRGFVRQFELSFTHLQVVLTGGDATFFQDNLKIPNLKTEPHLTLYGLNNILLFNRKS